MSWKNWSYPKKGFVVGLIFGAVIANITFWGVFFCHWNPFEGSVVPRGICESLLVLYFPYFIFHIPALVIVELFDTLAGPGWYWNAIISAVYLSSNIFTLIIYALVYAAIGALIGWSIGKIKSENSRHRIQ